MLKLVKLEPNNGGILENEVVVDGEVVQRYWIENSRGKGEQ